MLIQNLTSQPLMKRIGFFFGVFLPSFCVYRSMKLLRLFSDNLPAIIFMQLFLLDHFCAFLLEHSLTSQVTFSRLSELGFAPL